MLIIIVILNDCITQAVLLDDFLLPLILDRHSLGWCNLCSPHFHCLFLHKAVQVLLRVLNEMMCLRLLTQDLAGSKVRNMETVIMKRFLKQTFTSSIHPDKWESLPNISTSSLPDPWGIRLLSPASEFSGSLIHQNIRQLGPLSLSQREGTSPHFLYHW